MSGRRGRSDCWLEDCLRLYIPVVIEQVLVYFYVGIDDFPEVELDVIPLDVRREIPLSETTSQTSYFIEEVVIPLEERVRSRRIVQTG